MLKKIENIFQILSKQNPNPKTELNYTNNFTLLIAIVLSAQSTDVGVNKVTEKLFQNISSPKDILSLGIENLKHYIKSLGLFNSKAQNIFNLSRMLIEQFNGIIPNDLENLQKLPGVGSKTAKVFLNCALQIPVIAVDTHVFRVSKRLDIARGKTAIQVENELNKIVPSQWKLNAHHWLILHGRYVCKAIKPCCTKCSLQNFCKYYKEKHHAL